ncbi:lipocalin family protein [Lunatibacter salilacus]|uniref:lipocalin family protein n=1 Tax=Lunatibacter salilacus TaxID=2483804 RepID=UPI00131BE195|nr:lipocalin family protein [Lunatibacter salilacus]
MKTTYKLICYLFLVAYIIACGKGDDPQPTPPPPTKKDLLTQTWRLVKVTANGADQPSAGYTVRFTSTNTYTANGPMLTVAGSGNWGFNSGETAILLNGGPEQFRIVTLSAEQMVLEVDQETYKAGELNVRFEFQK